MVVFDFLLRKPKDNIIFFDEPELHLHPELCFKLIQALKLSGERNQFIFCTHSSEIITSSLDNTVVFIKANPNNTNENQAIVVKENDETNKALKMLGHSVGIISLGKKIVLIEGENSSLDKKTYGSILQNKFPNLVLVPCGGKTNIQNFSSIYEAIISKTLWGVEFFMLCDKDIPISPQKLHELKLDNSRVKLLNRYHIENYFLEEDIFEEVARLYGYNNFPKTIPTGTAFPTQRIPYFKDYTLEAKLKSTLTASGLDEVYTYSLISENDLTELNINEKDTLRVDNPVSKEFEYLRPTILGNLLKALYENTKIDKNTKVNLFELGKIYMGGNLEKVKEGNCLTIISNFYNFATLKGIFERLFLEIDRKSVV